MKNKHKKQSGVTRRKFLPFLTLLPFTGSAKSVTDLERSTEPSYQTMLTKDGKVVKVRSEIVNDSKIIDKQLSNRSLLKWLKKSKQHI
jgi:hypothetical protein